MINIIKRNKLLAIILIIYVVLAVYQSDMALQALDNSTYYLIEMAQILPVIFMLTVSIDVLIPKEWIVKRLGKGSGLAGAVLALAFGSLSVGPIYAAFPITKTLHKKGASVSNIVIILSAWAVVKVPMLANEAKFLGPEFMAVRWILTVMFIFVIGFIMNKLQVKIEGEEEVIEKEVYVKSEYCIGCTACERRMPEGFKMEKGKAYVIDSEISLDDLDEENKELLLDIAGKCPTKAILVKE